jgi:hypothetical protein
MTTESSMTGERERPGGITFVLVLSYIVSISIIVNGIFVILDADTLSLQVRSGSTKDELMWAGIGMIVLGVIGVLLTGALGRGSRVVRILFTIWIALQIAGGLSAMLSYNGEERAVGVLPFVLGIIVLYLLFNEKAHDYFAKE